jgi:FkbM family methyltransferase
MTEAGFSAFINHLDAPRLEGLLHWPFDELPEQVFRDLAHLLYELQPLARCPGWRFAQAELEPTPAVRVRFAMWEAARRRPGGITMDFPWHEETRIRTPLGNDCNRCVFVSGSFEPNELTLMRDFLEPGMIMIDAGANEGLFTLVAAKRVGPRGHVYAFEPSPRERAILETNVALNALENVTVLQEALTDTVGEAPLTVADEEHSGQNTLGALIYDGVTPFETIGVKTQTLDSFARLLGLRRLDFIKADVEGSELKMIAGGIQTLTAYGPRLVLEMQDKSLRGQGSSAAELCMELGQLGYQLYEFGTLTGLPNAPLSSHDTGRNIFATYKER